MTLPNKFKFVVEWDEDIVYTAVMNGGMYTVSWSAGEGDEGGCVDYTYPEVQRLIEHDKCWKIIEDVPQASVTGEGGKIVQQISPDTNVTINGDSSIYGEVMDFVSETDSSVTFSAECFEVVYGTSCTSARCDTLDELRAVMDAVRTLKKYGG